MGKHPAKKKLSILLVEDSPDDVDLTFEALKEAGVELNTHVVENGVDALAFLQKEGKYADAPRPSLILLDLNLPRKDGREVLAEIKATPSLCQIPVIVLTTSSAEEDIQYAHAHHANCYIRKPIDLDSFLDVIKSIQHFWLNVVELPHT